MSQAGTSKAQSPEPRKIPTPGERWARNLRVALINPTIYVAAISLRSLRLGNVRKKAWLRLAAAFAVVALLGIWLVQRPGGGPAVTGLAYLNAPVEYNEWKRLPEFKNATLNAVTVLPSGRVFVGGNSGLLAYSDDKGQSWTSVSFDEKVGTFHAAEVSPPLEAPAGNAGSDATAAGQNSGTSPRPPVSHQSAGASNSSNRGATGAGPGGAASKPTQAPQNATPLGPKKNEATLFGFELIPRAYAAGPGQTSKAPPPASSSSIRTRDPNSQSIPSQQNVRQQGPSQEQAAPAQQQAAPATARGSNPTTGSRSLATTTARPVATTAATDRSARSPAARFAAADIDATGQTVAVASQCSEQF